MRLNKKKKARIEIRIDEEDKLLLRYCAVMSNCDLSTYLQKLISQTVEPVRRRFKTGGITNADVQAICDDKLQLKSLFKGKVR